MSRYGVVGAACLGVIVLLSCAERGPTEIGGSPDAGVVLSPVFLVSGETTTVAALLPDAESPETDGRQLRWSTSEPGVIALVDDTLLVSLAEGAAQITVAVGSSRSHTIGQVLRKAGGEVASISVTVRDASLRIDDTTRAVAELRDADGRRLVGRAVVWISSNPFVATVTQAGRVRARARGTARIIAFRRGLIGSAVVGVNTSPVEPPAAAASVSLRMARASLVAGDSTTAVAIVRDSAGTVLVGRSVKWSSDRPDVATVSDGGFVRGVAAGHAQIVATVESVTGAAALTVSPAPPAPVASVDVALASGSLIVGRTTQATATTRDAGGAVVTGRTITWSSDNAAIAMVGATGLVTAVAPGSATISATSESRTGSAAVSVAPPPPAPVASVDVTLASGVVVGQTTQATATTRDASGTVVTGRTIVWSTDNTAIATVTASGLVTAVAAGSAAISAASEGKSGNATTTVSAPPPSPVASVDVTLATGSLVVGQTTQATAVTRDASGMVLTGRAIIWSSSNTAIATVSAAGFVTAVAAGSATISAASEGTSGTATTTVTAAPPASVASVDVSLASSSVIVGQTTQATAVMRDASGTELTGRAITWSSSNTAIATVSAAGLVTAITPGSATIAATSESKSGNAALSVASPPAPVASVDVALATSGLIVGQTTQATATTRDAGGNILTGRTITWSSSNTAIATVNASGLVTAMAAGSATISATSEGRAGSTAVQVAADATRLAVAVQPAGAVSGLSMTTQPVVHLRDEAGSTVATASAAVTAALTSGSGTLAGTTTVVAVNGIASFAGLRVDGAGPHTISFSAPGLAGTSATNVVVTQTPAALLIVSQPGGARTGTPLSTQPVVRILDNAGLVIASSALVVSSALASGSGTLSGGSVAAAAGEARFTTLRVDGTESVTITFSTAAPSLRVTSAPFSISVGPSTKLTLTTGPSSTTTSGTVFALQPVLQLRDAADAAVPQAGVVVQATLASGAGTLGGALSATTNGSGVASFTGLAISGADGSRTLTFSAPSASPSVAGVTSGSIVVATPPPVGASCPNEPAGYARIQDQTWDVSPARGVRTSLGWIDEAGNGGTKLSIVSDPTSPFASTNNNVVAGLFRQGDAGGSAPFYVYRPFGAGEQYRNLYLCVYMKHSANFNNTNGNAGTKWLWPSGSVVQGTETYLTFDGGNMDFGLNQQGSANRESYANTGQAGAASLLSRRGQWVRYEVLLRANTAGMANGGLDVWIDGVQTHRYTNMNYSMGSSRTWQSLAWNPTYGGGLNPVPNDQYEYIDHIRISGGNP